jgi:hypothetical protein
MSARGHIALIGDSIFDNGEYVPGEPTVLEQLRVALPGGWQATLLAVDGASATDVREQLARISGDMTHVFVSAGGNDALNESAILTNRVQSVAEAQDLVAQSQARFRRNYEALASAVLGLGRRSVFCTIYDSIPGLSAAATVALAAFNDVILRTGFRNHAPLIDLRLVCDDQRDYSSISEIEPSSQGGAKIARVIAEVATGHDFGSHRSVVYP